MQTSQTRPGSFVIGFLLGFFFGCIALVALSLFGKPATRSGALAGFGVQLVLGIALAIILWASGVDPDTLR